MSYGFIAIELDYHVVPADVEWSARAYEAKHAIPGIVAFDAGRVVCHEDDEQHVREALVAAGYRPLAGSTQVAWSDGPQGYVVWDDATMPNALRRRLGLESETDDE